MPEYVSEDPALLEPKGGIDFEALPWFVNCTDHSNYVLCQVDGKAGGWGAEHYDSKNDSGQATQAQKYTQIGGIFPSCTSLNYSTTVWEGLKAFRTSKGRCVVFRPDKNFERMSHGAGHMLLPMPSREMWFRAVQTSVRTNSSLIPPYGEGMKLYIRPILFGSGQQLGLYPSPQFSFCAYVAPTGNYFKSATEGLKLNIEKVHGRAMRGGFGSVKCAGNYAVCLLPLTKSKNKGFSDNIYLELESFHVNKEHLKMSTAEAMKKSVIQEMSAANIFVVQKEKARILTPSLRRKTILPGVTRDTVIKIVEAYNEEIAGAMFSDSPTPPSPLPKITLEETDVLIEDLADASECFATGTAAELVAIQEFGEYLVTGDSDDIDNVDEGRTEADLLNYKMSTGKFGGPVMAKILQILREIMFEQREDKFAWLRDPFASVEDFRK
ncbi:unnamed protein product [Amoebophrya sp. A25]|nr:unnamed protein product [Amoebophrya sp. A25]|eukprot:GSA25T00001306001.1